MSRKVSPRLVATFIGLSLLVLALACAQAAPPAAKQQAPAPAPAAAPAQAPAAAPAPAAPAKAPAPAAAVETPRYGGVLSVMISRDVRGVDPQVHFTGEDGDTFGGIHDNLLRIDTSKVPDLVPLPNIATKWEFVDGGKALVMDIKQGIKFHDGTPLTMADILHTFDRALTGKATQVKSRVSPYIKSAEATGPWQLRLNLVHPPRPNEMMSFLVATELKIVPKHIYALDIANADKAIGSGPFRMKDWSPERAVWVRNPDYHRSGVPYLDGVEWTKIVDHGTQLAAFRVGRLHLWTGFTPVTYEEALKIEKETAGKVKVQREAGKGGGMLFLNPSTNPALADVRVRKAIFLALDRKDYVERLFSGLGTGGAVLNPAVYPDVALSVKELESLPGFRQPKDADLQTARALVKEAGFEGAKVKIMARTYGGLEEASILMAAHIKKSGLNVEVEAVEPTVGLQRMGKSEFEMFSGGYGSLDADSRMFDIYQETHSWNFPRWVDPKMKQFREDYLAAWQDPKKQTEIAREFQLYLLTPGHPWIPLNKSVRIGLIDVRLKGHVSSPVSYALREYDNVWLAESK